MKDSFSAYHLEQIGAYSLGVRRSLIAGAKTLILVHGIGVSGTYYLPFARAMSQDYSVHVIDLPGYGKTPKPPSPLPIPELARILREYIHRVGITGPVLVGHSMGCQIIAHVWAQEPDIGASLILLGPTVNPKERSVFLQALRLLQDIFKEPLSLRAIVLGDYLHMGPIRYLRTSRNMVQDKIEKTLENCALPVLIVRGERDSIVPKTWAQRLASILPQSKILTMPHQPHIVQFQHPEELAAVLHIFIDA